MISSVKPFHPPGVTSMLPVENADALAQEIGQLSLNIGTKEGHSNAVEAEVPQPVASVVAQVPEVAQIPNTAELNNTAEGQTENIHHDIQSEPVPTENIPSQVVPDSSAEFLPEISKMVGVDYVYLSSKPIFDGANGVIYRGTDTKNTTVFVIKTVKVQKDQLLATYRRSVIREFDNLKKCANSKQVVTVVDIAANQDSPDLSLIVKYYPNGDLLDFLCKLRTKKVELKGNLKDAIFKQIVRGVDFLHRHNIAHRDIKPENFLIDECGVIKLNDFGYSLDTTRLDEQLLLNDLSCGTPSFKAPELYQIEKAVAENTDFDAKLIDFKMVDIWALGVLTFQLFLMSKPWQHANVVTDAKNMVMEKFIKYYPDNEKHLINLVNKLNDRNHSVSTNPALSLFKKLHYDARILALEMLHPAPEKRCTTEKLLLSNWLTQAYADPKDLIKLIPK
ncbi:CIC11C00000003673 [Sungouiella intermedia]|uniref:CIC11C00000003673 n=1 Tax=Sungouiella intermedia TaxID=45354 RepID=A0A1L0D890_9ASCO|nr:CIC11C00000003673 [[Candida] intermedia]